MENTTPKKYQYNINEIYKYKLLLSRNGTPYKTKKSIIKIVNSLEFTKKNTKFGVSKLLTFLQIQNFNHNQRSNIQKLYEKNNSIKFFYNRR